MPRRLPCLLFAMAALAAAPLLPLPAMAGVADHREFEATLHAPYRGVAGERRTFTLRFDYPGLAAPTQVMWTLELIRSGDRVPGAVLRRWQGTTAIGIEPVETRVTWDGTLPGGEQARGTYTVHLHAALPDGSSDYQSWDILTGPAPAVRGATPVPPAPIASAAPAVPPTPGRPSPAVRLPHKQAFDLPYTVYYGNLHSQTNHSDGGAEVTTCTGAQDPQTGLYGPGDAWTYARAHGLDFLMTSEHNHMFDGSDGTNTTADPEWSRMLYRSGLTAANDFNTTHGDFVALYGMEWGVIGNGGHLNILNAPELLGWERNADGALLADLYTARGDYAALYTLMRQHGWIGQFNHPALTGQFQIDGIPLAYTPDGDATIALCEVLNTSAYSRKVNEDETSRHGYEDACNRALEAGYHIAFSSSQDNHCANWGAASANRTAVLVPRGRRLSTGNLLEAIRARRVFATMDKTAQLVLTANGHLMGERFASSGPLTLEVHHASGSGKRVAAVAIMEGVPGRNGKAALAGSEMSVVLAPAPGEHFYYAKVTQDDGTMLWTAPVWVTQRPAQNP